MTVPDEIVTVDGAVTPMDVFMHSAKYIGIVYKASIAIHMCL